MINQKIVKNLIFIGLLILASVVKIQVYLLGFSPLDGVWQLSSWCSSNHTDAFINHYTLNPNEHFYIIAQVLSPLLGLMGSTPMKYLFFAIFVLNAILTWLLLKPVNFLQKLLFILIICNAFFHQGRVEDLAITILLWGYLVIQHRPNFQFVVFVIWMILLPLLHPVAGLFGIMAILFILWRIKSTWKSYLPISLGLGLMLILFFLNAEMYLSQLSYRGNTNYLKLITQLFWYLIPLGAVFLLKQFRLLDFLFLMLLMIIAIGFGKAYYLGNVIPILLIVYSQQKERNLLKPYSYFFAVLVCFGLLIFPINKIVQWIENPSLINREKEVMMALSEYHIKPDQTLFIAPNLVEPFLNEANTKFVIFDPNLNQLFTYRPLKTNDVLVLTDKDELEFVRKNYHGQYQTIDTLLDKNIGPLLLSSGYAKRKNGVNLWVVKF